MAFAHKIVLVMTDILSLSRIPSLQSSLLKWLRESEISYWQSLSILLFSACVMTASVTSIPLIIGQLSIHASPGGNRLLLHELPLLLAVLLMTSIAASHAGHYTLHRLQGQLALILRDKLLPRLIHTTSDCADVSSERIKSRYFGAVDHLFSTLTRLVESLFRDLPVSVGLTAVLLYINQELALPALIVLTITLLMQPLFATDQPSQTLSGQVQDEIASLIHNMITHRRLIELDQGILQEKLNIHDILDRQQRAFLKQTGHSTLIGLLVLLLLIGLMTVLLYFWLQQMTLGKFMPGEIPAFVAALLILILPLKRLLAIRHLLADSHRSWQPVAALLNTPHLPVEAPDDHSSANDIRRLRGSVDFENVCFYSNTNPPRSISCPDFSLMSGEVVAITDFTPDSAQILASLVCGLTPPVAGRVMLDKQNAVDIDPLVCQASIAWLSPARMLLNDTVAANIAYGMKRCSTESEITRAARTSHATEFIRELPRGYETRLAAHNEITLTASQRQRLLIARALLKNPAIVILDESMQPFELNEPLLLQALLVLIEKRTTLILSTQPTLLDLAKHRIELSLNNPL